mgnify:CR=1 FL=1
MNYMVKKMGNIISFVFIVIVMIVWCCVLCCESCGANPQHVPKEGIVAIDKEGNSYLIEWNVGGTYKVKKIPSMEK